MCHEFLAAFCRIPSVDLYYIFTPISVELTSLFSATSSYGVLMHKAFSGLVELDNLNETYYEIFQKIFMRIFCTGSIDFAQERGYNCKLYIRYVEWINFFFLNSKFILDEFMQVALKNSR